MDKYQDFAEDCLFNYNCGLFQHLLDQAPGLIPIVPPHRNKLASVTDEEMDALETILVDYDLTHWKVLELGYDLAVMIDALERGELDVRRSEQDREDY